MNDVLVLCLIAFGLLGVSVALYNTLKRLYRKVNKDKVIGWLQGLFTGGQYIFAFWAISEIFLGVSMRLGEFWAGVVLTALSYILLKEIRSQ